MNLMNSFCQLVLEEMTIAVRLESFIMLIRRS